MSIQTDVHVGNIETLFSDLQETLVIHVEPGDCLLS